MGDPTNPFSAIFSTVEAVERQMSAAEQQRLEVGDSLARVFLCSPTSSAEEGRVSRPRSLVTLPQLARDLERSGRSTWGLDLDSLAKVYTNGCWLSLRRPDLSLSLSSLREIYSGYRLHISAHYSPDVCVCVCVCVP